MTEQALDSLSVHLEGIHKALRSLARHLEGQEKGQVVRSQLEWSASHLYAAIRELRGEVLTTSEAPRENAGTSKGGLMEGLRGHAQAITIPEILGFVASLRKSGVLRVNSRREAFLIQLEEGAVVYAQGDNPPNGELLGEILVRQGTLTQAELDSVIGRDANNLMVLGRTLLNADLVGKEALCIALAFQVQLLFHRMFNEKDAVFQFDEGMQLMEPEDIRLNVTSLLLESARSSDESLRDLEKSSWRRTA